MTPPVRDAPESSAIDRIRVEGETLGELADETSFATVLRRLPTIEPADEPRWKPGYIIRGLESLRVRR